MLKPKNTLLKPTGKSAIKIPNQEMTPKYNGTADVTGVNNNGIAYKNYGATENTGPINVKGGSSAPKYSDNVGGLSYVGTPSVAPGSADVKYSDAETGSTEPSTPVQTPSMVKPMTYEEYLKSAYDKTVNNAEEARNKAIIDAQVSYQQNKATYGAKAEAMGAMGLTGSGYSDYLDAQAYNTSRNEVAVANAQAEKAKQQAEMTYSQGMLQLQESQNSTYNEILKEYGNSIEVIKASNLSDEQKQSAINSIQTNAYNEFSYDLSTIDIANGNFEGVTEIQKLAEFALKTGELSQNNVNQLITDYMTEINKIDIGTYFNDKTIETAKEELSYIKNDKWIDQATKDKFERAYNSNFNIEVNDKEKEKNVEVDNIMGLSDKAERTPEGYKYTSNTIDIYDSNFTRELLSKQYEAGSASSVFVDTYNVGSKQCKYLIAIINDAKAGKIKQGQYIRTNYGSNARGMGWFVYLGEGKFRAVSDKIMKPSASLYIPNGYKVDKASLDIKEE